MVVEIAPWLLDRYETKTNWFFHMDRYETKTDSYIPYLWTVGIIYMWLFWAFSRFFCGWISMHFTKSLGETDACRLHWTVLLDSLFRESIFQRISTSDSRLLQSPSTRLCTRAPCATDLAKKSGHSTSSSWHRSCVHSLAYVHVLSGWLLVSS